MKLSNFLFTTFFLFSSVLLWPQSDGKRGLDMKTLAAGDLAAGRLEGACEKYEEAFRLLEGLAGQECFLMSLRLRLDLGRYERLTEEASGLAANGMSPEIRRGSRLVQIHSLIRLGNSGRALEIIKSEESLLIADPSSALGLSDAYRQLDLIPEAQRVEWIIKRDFPKSPEAMILTGRAERRVKPSLIF